MHAAVRRSPGGRAAAVLLSVALAAAGCSGGDDAVDVQLPEPSAQERAWCARLADRLPESLGADLDRRRTDPASPLVTAWGSPAVVLRCGVGNDSGYPVGAQLLHANSEVVGWWQSRRGNDVLWSTPTAPIRVELVVPAKYESHGGMLATLSPVIESNGVF
ncbi:MAG TPA: DUF3515 family protein [Mycobacteriales bacterium]|jgi:hypothetical protein|nr:DUF3515 family protein [Mycobacteriales bacterium]